MPISKRMRTMLAKKPQSEAPVPLPEAVAILKSFPPTKFDQTVEIHMRLGIDPKQADQIIRGSLVLPHGIGKSKRVVVFAKGGLADDARAAGAEEVGADELAKKIKEADDEIAAVSNKRPCEMYLENLRVLAPHINATPAPKLVDGVWRSQ